MIRVLVVDDSSGMRKLLGRMLEADGDIQVAGTAGDPYQARDQLAIVRPDVMTLDIEMPRMNGLEFLKKLMAHRPLPVVMISSLTRSGSQAALEALLSGAMEVLGKPESADRIQEFAQQLRHKIRAVHAARKVRVRLPAAGRQQLLHASGPQDVLAIGASTGGIDAILKVLSAMPADTPPTLITQHLPASFTATFAKMLNDRSAVRTKEAEGGERLEPGLAFLAPGNRHLLVKAEGGRLVTEISDGPEVCYQRPSVEVLFNSVARCAGCRAVGVLLTGMGNDGANGLLAMRQSGAFTIAQNEATSVVWGMPKVAAELGAARAVLPLDKIPLGIVRGFRELDRKAGASGPGKRTSTGGGE